MIKLVWNMVLLGGLLITLCVIAMGIISDRK